MIESVVLPQPQRDAAFILTEVLARFGKQVTYGHARRAALNMAIPSAERAQLAAMVGADEKFTLAERIDWSRFKRHMWLTQQEADGTMLRLLVTLHPDRVRILDAVEHDVKTTKLLSLYPEDSEIMLHSLLDELKNLEDDRLEELHTNLLPFEPTLLNERMRNTGYHVERLTLQAQIREQMPMIGLWRANLLVPILSYVFTWAQHRGEWTLGDQINYVHLTDSFVDAWQWVAQRTPSR